jgi:hypothetical protein
MHRGLPLLVGLKSEMLVLLSSELGSGLPISLGDICLVLRNILCRLLGDLVGTVAEAVVSTCNAILHSKCAHKTPQ